MVLKVEPGNLLKMPQILKVPEIVSYFFYMYNLSLRTLLHCFLLIKVMGFITMMVARLSGPTTSTALSLETADAAILLAMAVYAYFFILLVQLIGILGGDKSPVQVRRKHIVNFIKS